MLKRATKKESTQQPNPYGEPVKQPNASSICLLSSPYSLTSFNVLAPFHDLLRSTKPNAGCVCETEGSRKTPLSFTFGHLTPPSVSQISFSVSAPFHGLQTLDVLWTQLFAFGAECETTCDVMRNDRCLSLQNDSTCHRRLGGSHRLPIQQAAENTGRLRINDPLLSLGTVLGYSQVVAGFARLESSHHGDVTVG